MKQDPLDAFLACVASAPQRLVADPSDAALREHVADAHAALPLLEGATGPLIDVGSGAGFPGIPLLLARPDLTGVLLESRARRCEHLEAAVQASGCADRVQVCNLRAEEYAAGDGREAFGICVARALAPPPVAVELCLPLVRVGGVLVLHAGAVDADALAYAAAELGGAVETVRPMPGYDQRCHVVVRRTSPTPARFPRRVGAAAREPLVRPAL